MPQEQNVIYFSKQGLSYCLGVLLDKLKLLEARTVCVQMSRLNVESG